MFNSTLRLPGKRLRQGLALLLLLLPLACSDDPAAPDVGSVEGSLLFRDSGEPVRDALLLLVEPRTLIPAAPPVATDEAGGFVFRDVPNGFYFLWIHHGSSVLWPHGAPAVTVAPDLFLRYDRMVIENPLFTVPGPVVRGTVRDAVTGEPLAGAYVGTASLSGVETAFALAGGSLPMRTVTDAEGSFLVTEVLAIGDNEVAPLTAVRAGYRPHTLVGTGTDLGPLFGGAALVVEDTLTVEFLLVPETDQPTGSLAGRVIDLVNLRPVADGPVAVDLVAAAERDTLSGPDPLGVPMPGFVTRTDDDGRFRIDGLPPGTYVVEAVPYLDDGFVQEDAFLPRDPVTVTPGDTTDVGSIQVFTALRPLRPFPGEPGASPTPTFEFEPVTGASYYEVQFGTGYLLDRVIRLDEPVWEVPAETPLPAGASIRWLGIAYRDEGGSVREIGAFEFPATFTVRDTLGD